jgi:hypothetical protein
MRQKKIGLVFALMIVIALLIPFHSTSSAQETDRPPLKIVQIGDSYSAGNGARSFVTQSEEGNLSRPDRGDKP